MLALDDAAFARVCIAATAVPPEHRSRWLRDIAERLDPPPARARPATARVSRRSGRCAAVDHVGRRVSREQFDARLRGDARGRDGGAPPGISGVRLGCQ
jgi:hypothetical protein